MPRGVLLAVAIAFAAVLSFPLSVLSEPEPAFQLGFKTLADLIPDVVGSPLEDERHNPLNGDGLQQTTKGLMVWRKADNWTAFTNGFWTWVNGPYGVQDRSNLVRFIWEVDTRGQEVVELDTGSPISSSVGAVGAEPTPNSVPPSDPPYYPYATPTPIIDPLLTSPLPTSTELPYVPPTSTEVVPVTAVPTSTPLPVPTTVPTSTMVPTRTPVPTAVPTATRQPTATRTPTSPPTAIPSRTPIIGGVRSPDPAGNWVTSVASTTKYYCSKDSTYWQSWSASNRIWFQTESALLQAYPGRIRHD